MTSTDLSAHSYDACRNVCTSKDFVAFESNLQSLVWSVHIADKLGVDGKHVDALCAEVIQESRQTN